MVKLSVNAILSKINAYECFHAVADDYSFTLKIESYVPYVCGAVHDGHQFRQSLRPNCLHSEYERWYEEDPCTKDMILDQPIVIAGCDSRFEYDLNRAPEAAIYTNAWGKQLWKTPLSDNQKQISSMKHNAFYKVLHALMYKLESMHDACIVYDMHSYNWVRWDRDVPTWNLGTINVDNEKYGMCIESWRKSLSEMSLPNGIVSTSKINDTFQGNGYFLKYITQHFSKTLVLATEIKKIYCDEIEHIIYPEVVNAIRQQLNKLILKHSKQFLQC